METNRRAGSPGAGGTRPLLGLAGPPDPAEERQKQQPKQPKHHHDGRSSAPKPARGQSPTGSGTHAGLPAADRNPTPARRYGPPTQSIRNRPNIRPWAGPGYVVNAWTAPPSGVSGHSNCPALSRAGGPPGASENSA